MIGADLDEVLPPSHREALFAAIDTLIDEFLDDVAHLREGKPFAETWMKTFLPEKYLHRYNQLFARQFLACLMTVAWKLTSPDPQWLACVGEELALDALLRQAEIQLDVEGEHADFGDFEDVAFEDTDFKVLFDPAWDGIEDSEVGEYLRMANLHLADWFKPFRESDPVHPYVWDPESR